MPGQLYILDKGCMERADEPGDVTLVEYVEMLKSYGVQVKKGHPASCGVPLAKTRFSIGVGDGAGSFLYCRLYLSRIGLDEYLQYVVGGHCRRVGIVKPVVEPAFLHSGIATSSLLTFHIL